MEPFRQSSTEFSTKFDKTRPRNGQPSRVDCLPSSEGAASGHSASPVLWPASTRGGREFSEESARPGKPPGVTSRCPLAPAVSPARSPKNRRPRTRSGASLRGIGRRRPIHRELSMDNAGESRIGGLLEMSGTVGLGQDLVPQDRDPGALGVCRGGPRQTGELTLETSRCRRRLRGRRCPAQSRYRR